MALDIPRLVGGEASRIAVMVARPVLASSSHLTFVSSFMDMLAKDRIFDKSIRKAMYVDEKGLPRFAIAALHGVFGANEAAISSSLGLEPEEALREFYGFAIRSAFPDLAEAVVQESLAWIPQIRYTSRSAATHYQLARWVVPVLPVWSSDWGVQSSRDIAVMGAMGGYLVTLNHMAANVWRFDR
jgi:hypothetical protein